MDNFEYLKIDGEKVSPIRSKRGEKVSPIDGEKVSPQVEFFLSRVLRRRRGFFLEKKLVDNFFLERKEKREKERKENQ